MPIYRLMSKNARAFKSTVGMSLQQFNFLMRDVERAYRELEKERPDRPGRKRQVGAGRPFAPHLWDRVLPTLVYCRTYLTRDGMTHIFVITQGPISTNIAKMAPIIGVCLPTPQDLYKKAKKTTTIQEMNEPFPELTALTGASGQPIQQPKRADTEKSHCSGKAKTHTVKTQYAMSADGLIMHRTAHSPGRTNDFKTYKMRHPTFPDNLRYDGKNAQKHGRNRLRHYADTAHGAMGRAVPDLDCTAPFRRKPGGDLTPEQRAFDREHSRVRIRAENGIRRVKTFRIMKERYRNKLKKYDRINTIVCGVVNQAIPMKREGLL